jgi:hypothetical protein
LRRIGQVVLDHKETAPAEIARLKALPDRETKR